MYGHVITKFPRMGSLPHFLTHGAPPCALHVRELHYYWAAPFSYKFGFRSPVQKNGPPGDRLRAVSYFSLQSYCTRAAEPRAARNEGVL